MEVLILLSRTVDNRLASIMLTLVVDDEYAFELAPIVRLDVDRESRILLVMSSDDARSREGRRGVSGNDPSKCCRRESLRCGFLRSSNEALNVDSGEASN